MFRDLATAGMTSNPLPVLSPAPDLDDRPSRSPPWPAGLKVTSPWPHGWCCPEARAARAGCALGHEPWVQWGGEGGAAGRAGSTCQGAPPAEVQRRHIPFIAGWSQFQAPVGCCPTSPSQFCMWGWLLRARAEEKEQHRPTEHPFMPGTARGLSHLCPRNSARPPREPLSQEDWISVLCFTREGQLGHGV